MIDYKNLRQFKKSEINGLTKHLMSLRFGAGLDSRGSWDAIIKRAEELGLTLGYSTAYGERLDFARPRKITREQTELGRVWLRNYLFKASGAPRGGKVTEGISDSVLKVAKSVSRFEFVGVQLLASSGWYPCGAVPIYRAYDRKGNYFDYSPIHWGAPIIHGEGCK